MGAEGCASHANTPAMIPATVPAQSRPRLPFSTATSCPAVPPTAVRPPTVSASRERLPDSARLRHTCPGYEARAFSGRTATSQRQQDRYV